MIRSLFVAVICLFGSGAFAQPLRAVPTQTIQAARQLFLNGDRRGALQMLAQELARLRPSDSKYKTLATEQAKIATRFLSDTGQKEYELAESMYFAGRKDVHGKYLEALKLEPENGEILESLVLESLHNKECDTAQEYIQMLQRLWTTYPLVDLLNLRLHQCQGLALTEQEVKTVKNLKATRAFMPTLEAQHFVEKSVQVTEERASKTITKAPKLKPLDGEYPENLYWNFRVGEVQDEGDPEQLKKYIAVCQNLTEAQRRRFRFDPYICEHVNEAQELVKLKEKEAQKR